MMKKRIAWIAAVMVVVCLFSVSALAVTEAICEHKNTYIDKVIVNPVSFGEGGHTYHYIGNVICKDCNLALSSYEDDATEGHSYYIINLEEYTVIDQYGNVSQYTITYYKCDVCGWQISRRSPDNT